MSLINALVRRPHAESPVPHTARRSLATALGGSRGDTARQLSMMGEVGTLFGIVHRTSTSTAAVDWHLYRKAASGKKEDRTEVTKHAALDVWNRPNPFFHRQGLVELVQQHVDLAGKGYLVLNIQYGLPLEIWWARPDRMTPVPHPTDYLAGWVYTSPDGEKVPLEVAEVIPLRMPDPMDPYGGMGPVQALQADLDSTRYSAEYNRNFFLNSAEPGGVVEAPEELDDDEFARFKERWSEQHRGVNRAHRVAVLEGGMKWVDRTISQKDMQFVELRRESRDTIMEAYTIHKAELGIAEDVNRANAEAGEVIFAKRLSVPRLERWKAALNWCLLPLYGSTARNLEFDYDTPVPEDQEAERANLLATAQAAQAYASAGWPLAAIAEALELPEALQGVAEPAPPPPPVLIPPPGVPAEEEEPEPVAARAHRLDRPRAEVEDPSQVDHSATQAVWEHTLAALLAEWGTVTVAWRKELVGQIIAAIDAGELAELTRLGVDSDAAAVLLADYLDRMAGSAAEKVVREAASQGVDGVEPKTPARAKLDAEAAGTAAILGAALSLSAGREALRVRSPELSGRQVADLVDAFMADLTPPKAELGGALTGAQNEARLETFRSAPTASLYASEKLDSNTCKNCREIDGRFIGLSDSAETTAEVARLYPFGGYVDCLGRSRCRGLITGVWRPQQTEDR